MALTQQQLNQYWRERGENYFANESRRLNKAFHLQMNKHLLAAVRSVKHDRILDLGCGYGRFTEALVTTFPDSKVIGIDLSPSQIEHARNACPKAEFRQGDMYRESLPKVDLIVAVEVFLHVPHGSMKQLLSRIFQAAPVLIHEFDPMLKPDAKTGHHVFAHDYETIYAGIARCDKSINGQHGVIIAHENPIHSDLVRAASTVD